MSASVRRTRALSAVGVLAVLLALAAGCGGRESETARAEEDSAAKPAERQGPAQEEASAGADAVEAGTFVADFETSEGEFAARLEADLAPNTVANFVHLATTGFYDGLIFHRVVPGFVIQGGCPNGVGNGGPGWRIADEFSPELRHDGPGILSMANSGPNTNGSQFFVTLAATPHLDDKHSVFGEVIEGMEVVSRIARVPIDRGSQRPRERVTIHKVTIIRDGEPLTEAQPMPETL